MTTTVKIQIELPDALAREVVRMGLLEPKVIQALLREAVHARRIERIAEASRKIAAAGVPPLTMDEINSEIKTDRAERRAAKQ